MTVTLSAALMIALQLLTLVAMVIAPICSDIEQQANGYKIASVCGFVGVYYCLVLRRKSLIAAIALPAVQIVLSWLFLGYINSLPMTCPR